MPTRVLPDVEKLLVAYLKAHTDVTALVSGRVSTELPETPTFPWLQINRIGGLPAVPRHLDAGRVQVSAWGDTKSDASSLARTALAALWELDNWSHADGVISGVEDDLGLAWVPDDSVTPARPRYVFGVAVFIHP